MPPEVPMTNASVLVALAMIGGVPKKSRAGKVTNVPPPATALIAPPIAAASISPRNSVSDMLSLQDMRADDSSSSGTCGSLSLKFGGEEGPY